jgi:Ca2+-binding RTX toxin-like protein
MGANHFKSVRLNTQSITRRAIATAIETLEVRSMLAVTATYTPASGLLSVFGDNLDNAITVSRNAAGNILVNGGAVAVTGGSPTVANTSLIQVFGQGGNDTITLSETNGALPAANLFGGADNDVLTSGSGADQLFGQAGNDQLLGKGGTDFLFGGADNDVLTGGDADDQSFGESGNDRLIWNPGDDTDLNEGGDDTDTVEVNGGNGAEQFTTTANGTRVRFDRINPAPFSIDIGTSENLVVNANGGDDSFSATGNLAALIQLTIDGGTGLDTLLGSNGVDLLLGGDGNDFIDGQQGNDVALMGAGDDVFQWDPGDGSDVIEGQANTDTMLFNGSAANEIMDAAANGGRVRFTRNIGAIVMDLNDVEKLSLNMLGGADTMTVGDLSGTDMTRVDIDLASAIGGATGDAAADSVIVNGTNGNDVVDVVGAGTSLAVSGLPALVNVTNSEGANDALVVNTFSGVDGVTATTLPAGVVKLTIDGGTNNDSLLGSQGADVFVGGDGNDFVFGDNGNDLALLGAGNDVFQWDPGDGNDTIEGQADLDSMLFFGSNASEVINIAANGGRVLFTRDVAAITMDLDDVEAIDFRALGGADNVIVGDLSGTDVTNISLDLRGPNGGGDGAADSVSVNATNGDDNFGAAGGASGVTTFGLAANVNILAPEVANDKLTLNALGGADVINATSLNADGMQLTQNGGLGVDLMLGGAGGELFNGGDGDDAALMGAGNDTFVWNPGDDNDTLEGQADLDTMLFNGANVSENIDISRNGGRVTFFRNVANVVMDLNDVERVDFNALGGADNIVINDLNGTDLTNINLNLLGAGNVGDAQPDALTFNGSAGSDVMTVNGDASSLTVGVSAVTTNVTGIEAANEVLSLNGLAGADSIVLGTIAGLPGLKLNLSLGGNDNAADQVTANATVNSDAITVVDTLNSTTIAGLTTAVEIFSAEPGNDSLRVNALAGADTITVNQTAGVGSVQRTIVDAGDNLDTITITNTPSNGSATILPSTGNDNVSVNVDGLFTADAIFQGTQRIGSLAIGPNGKASIAQNGGTILTASSLNITSNGKLDIANNHVVIDYAGASPFNAIRSQVITGFAGGAWNGNGIISSAAAANARTAIGYAEASAIFTVFPASFRGQNVDSTSVILSHTFKGDTNLDRDVSFDDLLNLAQNYNATNQVWSRGDFDYNGTVNFADLLSLAQNYNVNWPVALVNGQRRNGTVAADVIR